MVKNKGQIVTPDNEEHLAFLESRGQIFLNDDEEILIMKCFLIDGVNNTNYSFVKDFCKKYKLDCVEVYEVLKVLSKSAD